MTSRWPRCAGLANELSRLWRTTPFRLTVAYGLVFIIGIGMLLGAVYWRTADFLIRRVDSITSAEIRRLAAMPADALPDAVRRSIVQDQLQLNSYGLFTREGVRIAGNGPGLPAGCSACGSPGEYLDPQGRSVRAVIRVLPWGEVLMVGRDATQILALRGVILNALLLSGLMISIAGLATGVWLSREPIRRLAQLEATSRAIIAGDLARRMPESGSGDELDLFAGAVNRALAEIEALMADVKGVADAAAHDLRTPLMHVRTVLRRLAADPSLPVRPALEVERAIDQLDELLERFRAILRISEIEAGGRRSGFAPVAIARLVEQAVDLYGPLADAASISLLSRVEYELEVEADGRLLFEALANLTDNAIKFSGAGSRVEIFLVADDRWARLGVRDNGSGVAPEDQELIQQKFRRGAQFKATEGSGLGLSVVAAIARLHGFSLQFVHSKPGLEVSMVLPLARPADPEVEA